MNNKVEIEKLLKGRSKIEERKNKISIEMDEIYKEIKGGTGDEINNDLFINLSKKLDKQWKKMKKNAEKLHLARYS